MDVKEIQNLIKFVAKSGAHEVKLEMEDFKITIKTAADQIVPEQQTIVQHMPPMAAAPAAAAQLASTPPAEAPAPAVAAATETPKVEDHLITVKLHIGTFTRFTRQTYLVVRAVNQVDVLCVIEAMKLFNEIESKFSGKIEKSQ